MKEKYKRISQIENMLSMLVAQSGVSKHFFAERMTQEVMKTWEDAVTFDANRQKDSDAYSDGSADIYLFAKPIGEFGRKDVKKLDKMEELLDNAIKTFHHPHYTLQVNYRDSDYDKSLDFYYNVINISVHIK